MENGGQGYFLRAVSLSNNPLSANAAARKRNSNG